MLGTPGVLHTDKNGTTRMIDLTTRLLQDRIVLCTGEVNDELAESVVAQLLYLESESAEKPINMLINSQGGSCVAGLSIISTMKTISCPIHTSVIGLAASMGIVIAASGEKGHRKIYPFSRVMIHQTSGSQSGNIQDIRRTYAEMESINGILMKILAEACEKSVEQIEEDSKRDTWYNPEEIIEYGLIDKIAESRK